MAPTTPADLEDTAREQFLMFDGIAQSTALTDEERQRLLRLSDEEWSAWSRVPHGGELPTHPEVAVVLLRLGAAAHRLVVMAENTAAAALAPAVREPEMS
ncbi:MAG: hypothetical protein JOY66_22045 [Acetobacteraceae bacterium]|nr:hypothetical protein [Acetobacteraceae bacterium]